MKLGLGLYRSMLTDENFRFARQSGCTHIIAHLVDYYNSTNGVHDTDEKRNYGIAVADEDVWSYEYLLKLKEKINSFGLELYAIENFSPADWFDILLDGPKKMEQIEKIKTIIRRVGKVGIPVIGYNFSIAGVWGHIRGAHARGGAVSVGYSHTNGPFHTPIKKGDVWNMSYDPSIKEGFLEKINHEQLWERLEFFLKAVIPVAEEAGVRLAAHPDDPPMPIVRDTPRLVYQPHMYRRLLDVIKSKCNSLEYCMGTIQEMSKGNIYDSIEEHSNLGEIAYVHFRNVKGKVPDYHEVFIDEGDIDMVKAMKIFIKNGFDGVFIPDHTPIMECNAPWHAGMAHALGYINGIIKTLKSKEME